MTLPVGMAAGWVLATMAHCLASGLAGVVEGALAGPHMPVLALAVRLLELAAVRDGGVRFTMCFMLVPVVSCTSGHSLLSVNASFVE